MKVTAAQVQVLNWQFFFCVALFPFKGIWSFLFLKEAKYRDASGFAR